MATYVCATCEEDFTRRYSAIRHNITIHNGNGEIVTLLEYLVERNSGRYRPSHPSLYRRGRGEKRIHNFGHATTAVADSMGDTFRHKGLQGPQYQQQAPSLSIPQPSLPQPSAKDISPSQSMNTANDHPTQETVLKIQELKRLLYRQPIFSNPDAIIKCVTHFAINGDNTLLDEKLEQLRTFDSTMGTMGYPRM
jgi:hypothetical protein